MKTTNLVNELSALRAVVAIHAAKIDSAADVRDDAADAFESARGFFPWTSVDAAVYPEGRAWLAAVAAVEALKDEHGYYWTCARIHDIERVLAVPGFGGRPQLSFPFPDTCLPIHPAVGPWMASVLGIGSTWSVAA